MEPLKDYPIISWGKEAFQLLALSENACEFVWTVQPGGMVPSHLHRESDEHFEILEGEIVLTMAGRKLTAKAGETVTVPRMTPHSPANKSAAASRCRVWFAPAADQARFFDILFFLKTKNLEGMGAVIKAVFMQAQLGYREFSLPQGITKFAEKIIMGSLRLAAPLTGWNKLAQEYLAWPNKTF